MGLAAAVASRDARSEIISKSRYTLTGSWWTGMDPWTFQSAQSISNWIRRSGLTVLFPKERRCADGREERSSSQHRLETQHRRERNREQHQRKKGAFFSVLSSLNGGKRKPRKRIIIWKTRKKFNLIVRSLLSSHTQSFSFKKRFFILFFFLAFILLRHCTVLNFFSFAILIEISYWVFTLKCKSLFSSFSLLLLCFAGHPAVNFFLNGPHRTFYLQRIHQGRA